MTEHQTTVRSWPTNHNPSSQRRTRHHHAATCSCGWEGFTRGAKTEAEADAAKHRGEG